MYIQTVLLDIIIVVWRTLDHWAPKWWNRMILMIYITHYIVQSRIIMLNHPELVWLLMIETFPAFNALLYFSLGATKLKSL